MFTSNTNNTLKFGWFGHWFSFTFLRVIVPYVHINDIALKFDEVCGSSPNLALLYAKLSQVVI
jgi:hypothetical protein